MLAFISQLSLFQVSPLISLVFIMSLGTIVWLKNKQSILNRLFFLISVVFAIWQFGTFMMFIDSTSDQTVIFWDRFIYLGVVFMPALQYHFSLVFTYFTEKRKQLLYTAYILSIIFLALSRTNYFVNNVFRYRWGVHAEAQIIHHFFLAFFFFYVFALLYNFYIQYKKSSNQVDKHKLIYLIVSFAILNLIGGLGYLPAYKISIYSPISLLAPLIFSVLIAYTIIQYHLMDIEVIFRLGTIYSLLFLLISFIYTFAVSLLSSIVSGRLTFILPSILITLGFLPLKNLVENITDRIFFRKKFSTEEIINKLNTITHSFGLDLNSLLENFNNLIVDYIRVKHVAILILVPRGEFLARRVFDQCHEDFDLAPNHPIITYLSEHPGEIINKDSIGEDPAFSFITKELNRFNFSIVMPIRSKGNLIGMYFVGGKKSEDSFEKEEIDLLRLIATESALAIDNARFFEELKEADKLKTKFISVVSHQLRTPLTSVLWNTELIMDGTVEGAARDDLMKCIHYSASFIGEHISDMIIALDVENSKTGILLKKESSNFEELVKEAINKLSEGIKTKKLSLSIEAACNFPFLVFDQVKIKKVVSIMLKNAVLYSPENGKVVVSYALKEIGDKKSIEFSVSDEGIGMSDVDIKNIFSKFYRGDEAQRVSPDGFGLGLFITKNFIEAHGGTIKFESAGRGKGSVFSFSVPVE